MKTGIPKGNRITSIFTTEADDWFEITTFNTSLKKRLRKQAQNYPDTCVQVEIDEGRESFRIRKENLIFRIVPPMSEEQREAAHHRGKEHGFGRVSWIGK